MLPTIAHTLALVPNWKPFNDPLPLWQDSRWPWLLLPLCLGVCFVYKATRCKSMKTVLREAIGMSLLIILGMVSAAVALALLVRGLER